MDGNLRGRATERQIINDKYLQINFNYGNCKYAGKVDGNLRDRATERQKISLETTPDPPLGRRTFLYRQHFEIDTFPK